MRYPGPRVLRRCAENFEDLVQLIVRVAYAGEGRHAGNHLHKDTPDAPDVERGGVLRTAEQDICLNRKKNTSQNLTRKFLLNPSVDTHLAVGTTV